MKNTFCRILFLPFIVFFSCSSPSIIATRSITLGDQFNNTNDYPNAIIQYEEYLKIAPSLGVYRNPMQEANILRRLAHAYSTQGKYEVAQDNLEKALAIDLGIDNNKLNIIEDYRQLGIVSTYLGEYDKALSNLKLSIESSDGLENSIKDDRKLLVADTYLSLAQVNLTLGNFTETKESVEKARGIYDKINGEYRGEIETDLIMGMISLEFGEVDAGIELINKSRNVAVDQGFTIARQLNALANAFSLKGQLEDELRTRLDALREAEKSAIQPQIIMANIKIGDTYQSIGDDDKANEYYNRALEIQQRSSESSAQLPSIQMRLGDMKAAQKYLAQSNSSIGAGTACLRLGDSELSNGNIDGALDYYRQAIQYLNETSSREGQAKAALKLGSLLLDLDSLNQAEILITKSAELSVQPEINWQAEFMRGKLHEKREDYMGALDYYQKAISIIEKIRGNLTIEEFKTRFLDDKSAVYNYLLNLLIVNRDFFESRDMKPVQMAFNISEKARARTFLDMISNKKIDAKDDSDSELLDKELELRKKIEKLNKEIQRSNNAELKKEFRAITDEYDNLIERIKLENSSYSSVVTTEPPSLESIQSNIGKDAALIEYWLSDLGSYIFVIKQNDLSVFPVSSSKSAIVRLVKGARNMIKYQVGNELDETLEELYQALIAPIESAVAGVKSLGIVPHSSLHFLPFQTLKSPEGEFLISRFNLFYVPSAAIYTLQEKPQEQDTDKLLSLALGNLQLGGFAPLPGTKSEVEHIGQIYDNHTSLLEGESSESSFKRESKDADMIHIATHGTFNRYRPLYSYLLMNPDEENDGLLTVNEIFDLDLNSELVVLSACETGLGDLSEGDELTGLSRAFLYAGSPAIIVSLWKVDDASTSLLMTRIHQYIDAGYSLPQALTNAQKDLMNQKFSSYSDRSLSAINWSSELSKSIEEPKKHPYFWAPFVLIGTFNN